MKSRNPTDASISPKHTGGTFRVEEYTLHIFCGNDDKIVRSYAHFSKKIGGTYMKIFKQITAFVLIFALSVGGILPFGGIRAYASEQISGLTIRDGRGAVSAERLMPHLMGVPQVVPSTQADAALLRWDIPQAPAFNQTYLLYYYTIIGGAVYRIQLVVESLPTGSPLIPNPALGVHFDVYRRVGADFINIRNIPTVTAFDTNFRIYDTMHLIDSIIPELRAVADFFSESNSLEAFGLGEANRHSGLRHVHNDGGNHMRVNNRDRAHPEFPRTPPLYGNFGALTHLPTLAGGEYELPADFNFANLTPSFTIESGHGFSFEYYRMRMHFLWSGGHFYFHIDGGLQLGNIYEFHLYRFDNPHDAFNGATPTDANRGRIMYFPGIDVMRDVHIFPFAQNIDPAEAMLGVSTAPGGTNRRSGDAQRHTLPGAAIGDPLRHILPYTPGVGGFNTSPIILTDPHSTRDYFTGSPIVDGQPTDLVRPAADNNGIEIRFAIPRLLDMSLGRFVPFNQVAGHGLEIDAQISLGAYVGHDDISHNIIGENFPILAALTGFIRPPLSRFERVGHINETFIYVRVDGLPAGFVFDSSAIAITGMNETYHLLRTPFGGASIIASPESPIFTFIPFSIVYRGFGSYAVAVHTPFPGAHGEGRFTLYSGRSHEPGVIPATPSPMASIHYRREYHGDRVPDMPLLIEPVPAGQDWYWSVRVTFTRTRDLVLTTPSVTSQLVHFWPERRPPSVAPPRDFRLHSQTIRPMTPTSLQPMYTDVGLLQFTASWDIAEISTLQNIINNILLEHSVMGVGAEYVTHILIDYVLRQGYAPHIDERLDFDDWANISIEVDVSATPWRARFILQSPATGITIVNDGWFELGTDPAARLTANVVFNTTSYNRLVPAGDRAGFPLVHAGLHFMYAEMESMRFHGFLYDGTAFAEDRPTITDETRNLWRTTEEPLTLDEMIIPTAPAPIMLSYATHPLAYGHENAPGIVATYLLPQQQINEYRARMYHGFTDEISVNLYIGAFESSITQYFFSSDTPPTRYQRTNSQHVYVLQWQSEWSEQMIAILPASALATLRGRGDGTADTGVVRIENVPLPASGLQTRTLTIAGLDINVRYYIFADLLITPILDGVPGHPQDIDAGLSPLSNIVADTTPSVPTPPDPGDIDPMAPTGIGHHPPDTTSVTIYWTAAEIAPESHNEHEIVRIRRGTPMDEETLMRNTALTLAQVLNEIDSPHVVRAWRTFTYPVSTRSDIYELGATEPSTDVSFNFELMEFTDNTLLPNELYYFYVRTIQIVDGRETRSSWVEVPVTTPPVARPYPLRIIDGSMRPGFNPMTQVFAAFDAALSGPGVPRDTVVASIGPTPPATFMFQYQLRIDGGTWGAPVTLNADQVRANAMAFLNPNNTITLRYVIGGLRPGTVYQLQVRVVDISGGPANRNYSLWSNVVTFTTEFDPVEDRYDRDAEDWLEELRRRLEALLVRPYWLAQNTPTNTVYVTRPGDIFRGQMLGNHTLAVPLPNMNRGNTSIYIPASVIRDANENNRGFQLRFDDVEFMFAPGMLSYEHNQVLLDMVRELERRGTDLTDHFIRIDIELINAGQVHGVQTATRQPTITITAVGTNRNIRNIATWEDNLTLRARRIVDDVLTSPIERQNIINLLRAGRSNEEMVDHLVFVTNRVDALITNIVSGYMRQTATGIVSRTSMPITALDAPLHVTARHVPADMQMNAFVMRSGQWVSQTLQTVYGGRGITVGAPGTFAFTGQTITIHGGNETAHGVAATGIVAQFGLADLFGGNINLHGAATRSMVVGSVARMANAPTGTDAMTWAANNLNVQMSSRNATALINNQEAIAIVMALYERATGTTVASINVRNHARTANMTLDNRYAAAVRAAFEVGVISDTEMNPAANITVGDFLEMITNLNSLVRL
jgi:hypothetical protein